MVNRKKYITKYNLIYDDDGNNANYTS
jgi:hypothetical protein